MVNAPGKVKAYGFGLGIDYLLPFNFSFNANVSTDRLEDVPEGFRAQFNSPDWRTNLGLSNSGFGPKQRFGFNISWRYQGGFYYDSDFASADLPAVNTVDGQVSYKVSKYMFKIGATNLLNQYYRNGTGNASIGGVYYISFGYNL